MSTSSVSQNDIGLKFNLLTVVDFLGYSRWKCLCECGNITITQAYRVRDGHTKSCGCLRRKHGHCPKSKASSEYRSWDAMRQRCSNSHNRDYYRYGKRGVTVCERWANSFPAFLNDMGPKPTPAHTLDRYPDQKGNYEPDNCRWATTKEQALNRTTTRMITFNNQTMCAADWAASLGITRETMHVRLKSWTLEQALTTPSISMSKRARGFHGYLLKEFVQ